MTKLIPYVALSCTLLPSVSYATNIFDDNRHTLELSGRLEAQIAQGDDSFTPDGDTRGRITGRLAIEAQRTLSDFENSQLVGKLEWQVRTETNDSKLDSGEDLDARYAFMGIENDVWGQLVFGRTKNPLYQVMKITDKYKNFTPNVYNYGLSSIDTSFVYNRQDSTLQYEIKQGDILFQSAYVLGNGENTRLDKGMMVSLTDSYRFDSITLSPAIAASRYKRIESNSDTSRKQHDQILTGISLDVNNFNLGLTASYTHIEQDNGEDNYLGLDSVVSYQWNRTKILAGYSLLDERDMDIEEKKGWRIEGQWRLAKRTYLSLTYTKAIASKNVESSAHGTTLGLRYDF